MADGQQGELILPEELSGNEVLKPFIGKDPTELAKSYVELHTKASSFVPFEDDVRATLKDYEPERVNALLSKTKNAGAIAKNYIELEKRLGTSIQIPGKDAKPEEIKAFRTKLGIPETVDGYKVEIPQGKAIDPKRLEGFQKLALETGMPVESYQKAVLADIAYWEGIAEDLRVQTVQAQEKLDSDLHKEWGKDYDANLEISRRAAKTFAVGDDMAALERIIGSPALVKVFHRIGKAMAEGKYVHGDAQQQADRAAAQKRIDEIESKYGFQRDTKLMEERHRLYEILNPEEVEA